MIPGLPMGLMAGLVPSPDYLTFGIETTGLSVGYGTTSGSFRLLTTLLSGDTIRAADCKINGSSEVLLAVGYYNTSASAERCSVFVIDPPTGEISSSKSVIPTVEGQVQDISLSPDGSLLAIAMTSGPYLKVYEVESGNQVTAAPDFTGENAAANAVAFSYNGDNLSVGRFSNAPNPFAIYRVSDWILISSDSSAPPIDALAAFNTSSRVAAARRFASYLGRLYNPSRSNVGDYTFSGTECNYCAVNPDDTFAAFAGVSGNNGIIETHIVSSSDGFDASAFIISGQSPIAFTPDGKYMLRGDRVHDVQASFNEVKNLDWNAATTVSGLL